MNKNLAMVMLFNKAPREEIANQCRGSVADIESLIEEYCLFKDLTYKGIARKDDIKFVNAVRKILGQSFAEVTKDAEIAFYEAVEAELNKNRKANAARRAANLVYLHAIEDLGVTNWKEWEGSHKTKQDYRAMARPEYEGGPNKFTGKYKGPSILEMGEQRRKEIHEKYSGNK